MMNINHLLAVLAAMATLAVSAVPVCAETTDGNTREENLDIASDSDSFDTAEVEQNSYIIDEYIAKNDIDARCKYLGNADEPQDRIEIKYVNDKSRQQVESFIKEQGYDTTYITFSEMSEDDKFTFIAQRKLIRFRSKTGNSCDYRYNGVDSKGGEKSVTIICHSAHKADMDKIKNYIGEHEYEKIISISYKIVGDTNAVTDLKKIYTMLKAYIDEECLIAEQHNQGGNLTIMVGDIGSDEKEYSEIEKAIEDYMEKSNIDYSNVYIERKKDNFERDEKTVVAAIPGDANQDRMKTVRDCAYIAKCLSKGKSKRLPDTADYNKDGKKNVRDAASISQDLASK